LPIGLETEEREGALRASLSGELDLATAPDVEARLLEIESREPAPQHLILDLRAVRFIDSTGLSLLVNAHNRAIAAGRRFTVVSGTGPPRRILETTGLVGRLEVVEDDQPDGHPSDSG
jgi:anti-sigma B factor antagonist